MHMLFLLLPLSILNLKQRRVPRVSLRTLMVKPRLLLKMIQSASLNTNRPSMLLLFLQRFLMLLILSMSTKKMITDMSPLTILD